MKNFQTNLVNASRTTILICAIALTSQLTANAQEPVGPTKPVLVTNTSAQPVPVTGTVTGVVTLGNTPNVNVVNTPTVRIDPTSNSVVVAPRSTQLLVNTGIYNVSEGGYPAVGPFDASSFSKIRVIAFNQSDSDGPFSIFVSVRLPGGLTLSLDGSNFGTLQPGQSFNRVYDIPGQIVQVNVSGNGPNRIGAIAVFGQ